MLLLEYLAAVVLAQWTAAQELDYPLYIDRPTLSNLGDEVRYYVYTVVYIMEKKVR